MVRYRLINICQVIFKKVQNKIRQNATFVHIFVLRSINVVFSGYYVLDISWCCNSHPILKSYDIFCSDYQSLRYPYQWLFGEQHLKAQGFHRASHLLAKRKHVGDKVHGHRHMLRKWRLKATEKKERTRKICCSMLTYPDI